MKKLFVMLAIAGVASFAFTACGSKKDESKKEEENAYSDYETAEPQKASADDQISAGKALVDNSDCKTCHHLTNKILGPSHEEIAKKYEFTKANVAMLADKIIAGGTGNWGQIPMSPHPDLSHADAEKMAMYVLSLDGEKPKD